MSRHFHDLLSLHSVDGAESGSPLFEFYFLHSCSSPPALAQFLFSLFLGLLLLFQSKFFLFLRLLANHSEVLLDLSHGLFMGFKVELTIFSFSSFWRDMII